MGGTLIHPFDDPQVIAGQGTIGLELVDQIPEVDAVVIPVGGGGMISGIGRALKQLNPKARIIGVEPAKIPSMAKAMAGDMNPQPAVTTIADGINVSHPLSCPPPFLPTPSISPSLSVCLALRFGVSGRSPQSCVARLWTNGWR